MELPSYLYLTGPSRELARWIALFLMVLDHLAAALFPQNLWLRLPGRAVYPVFALFMGQTLGRGYPASRYISRLLPFALLAQPPYKLLFSPGVPWYRDLNILFTLHLGAFLWYILEKRLWLLLPPVALTAIWADYALPGVLLIPVAAKLYQEKTPLWWFLLLFLLPCLNCPSSLIPAELALSGGAFLAFPLLGLVESIPKGLPRGPWWLPYAFYPFHLWVAWFLLKTFPGAFPGGL